MLLAWESQSVSAPACGLHRVWIPARRHASVVELSDVRIGSRSTGSFGDGGHDTADLRFGPDSTASTRRLLRAQTVTRKWVRRGWTAITVHVHSLALMSPAGIIASVAEFHQRNAEAKGVDPYRTDSEHGIQAASIRVEAIRCGVSYPLVLEGRSRIASAQMRGSHQTQSRAPTRIWRRWSGNAPKAVQVQLVSARAMLPEDESRIIL